MKIYHKNIAKSLIDSKKCPLPLRRHLILPFPGYQAKRGLIDVIFLLIRFRHDKWTGKIKPREDHFEEKYGGAYGIEIYLYREMPIIYHFRWMNNRRYTLYGLTLDWHTGEYHFVKIEEDEKADNPIH